MAIRHSKELNFFQLDFLSKNFSFKYTELLIPKPPQYFKLAMHKDYTNSYKASYQHE